MKRLLFTHSADIDGMGNAILSKLAFDDVDIIYARNVGDLEPKFLKEYDSGNLYNYDFIYITDLSIKVEIAQKINSDEKLASKLYIFDHHETALISGLDNYSNGNVSISIDGRKTCATELFYKYLLENELLKRTSALDDFVEKVRLEDNWEWEENNDPLAHDIAILFSDVGIEDFVNIMVQLLFVEKEAVVLNENLKNRIKSKKEKIKIAINNTRRFTREESIDGIKTVFCFIDYEYRNDIAEYFKKNNERDYDVVAMIALDNDQVSIRGLKDNSYSRILAEKYGGGGHDTAAAIPLNSGNKSKIVDVLFNL